MIKTLKNSEFGLISVNKEVAKKVARIKLMREILETEDNSCY